MTPGTILVSQGTSNPFLLHKAIVVEVNNTPHVLHNALDFGFPRLQPLQEYFEEGRRVLWQEPTGLSSETLLKRHSKYAGVPYDALAFNCEHYINLLVHNRFFSPQIKIWGIVAGCFILLLGAIAYFRRSP